MSVIATVAILTTLLYFFETNGVLICSVVVKVCGNYILKVDREDKVHNVRILKDLSRCFIVNVWWSGGLLEEVHKYRRS